MLDTILNNNRNESASQFICFAPDRINKNRRIRKNQTNSAEIYSPAERTGCSSRAVGQNRTAKKIIEQKKLRRLFIPHKQSRKQHRRLRLLQAAVFCFAAQNKPQNMIEFSTLLCYNIEDYNGIYCHYCFRSVFVADNC